MENLSEDKKFSELVREEKEKGNVVFLCVDSIMCAPVKEIIKQPADGLLWDLNRDEATALTFMDKEGMIHWVNNFAVALVIRELKKSIAQLEAENEIARNLIQRMINWHEQDVGLLSEICCDMQLWLDALKAGGD